VTYLAEDVERDFDWLEWNQENGPLGKSKVSI